MKPAPPVIRTGCSSCAFREFSEYPLVERTRSTGTPFRLICDLGVLIQLNLVQKAPRWPDPRDPRPLVLQARRPARPVPLPVKRAADTREPVAPNQYLQSN